MTDALSHYAERLARYLTKHSKRGLPDPWDWEALKAEFTEDEQANLAEAAHELEQRGWITLSEAMNGDDNLSGVRPTFELHWAMDSKVFGYDIDDDVAYLIGLILEDEKRSSAAVLVKCQDWSPRRFNPAFARIVTLFPNERVYTAQSDEPYPAAGVLVTAAERAKLKTQLTRYQHEKTSTALDDVIGSCGPGTEMQQAHTNNVSAMDDNQDGRGAVQPAVPSSAESGSLAINLGPLQLQRPAPATLVTVLMLVALGIALAIFWPFVADRLNLGFERTKPVLLEPANAVTLTGFPRHTTLRWQPISGAARYVVEVQAQDLDTGEWFPHPFQSRWTTDDTSLTFEFIGDQPGRWQVVAIGEDNGRSLTSEWHEFFYESVPAEPPD